MDEENNGGLGIDAEDSVEEKPDPKLFKADLYDACFSNDFEKVNQFLEEMVPPTYVDEFSGWTPLHWAANHGNVEMVEALIGAGASQPYHRMVLRAKREAEKKNKEEGKSREVAEVLNLEEEDVRGGMEKVEDADVNNEGVEASPSEGVQTQSIEVTAAEPKNGTTEEDDSIGKVTEAKEKSGEEESAAAAEASAESKPTAEDEFDEDDDEDLDYETAMERKLETSTDLTKNTPLLWACSKGHLRIIWLLLLDGYDPNDFDNLDNNALHLAAAANSLDACKVIIDAGAKATLVNKYKNLPVTMATLKPVKDLIQQASINFASLTQIAIETKREEALKSYESIIDNLADELDKARAITNPKAGTSVKNTIAEVLQSLTDVLLKAKKVGLPQKMIDEGEEFTHKLECSLSLSSSLVSVEAVMPMKDQKKITEYLHPLEVSLEEAKRLEIDQKTITRCEEIINRCQQEYWVCVLTARLEHIECAKDRDEHDLSNLIKAIDRGRKHAISPDILGSAVTLHSRLSAELGMTRALAKIPIYKLPLKEGAEYPDDYWQPEDIGHIEETPEYPHPPADTGEYKWISSKAVTGLADAILAIKDNYDGAEEKGANMAVVEECKVQLHKCEKDMKQLKHKDTEDKANAIEAAQKLCKKAKKGKKK